MIMIMIMIIVIVIIITADASDFMCTNHRLFEPSFLDTCGQNWENVTDTCFKKITKTKGT
jgi:hypothetical protein